MTERKRFSLTMMPVGRSVLLFAIWIGVGNMVEPNAWAEELVVNGQPIEVEVAGTLEERQVGLAEREFLPLNSGMLFVYPRPQAVCFWMKDTALPLSVAFLDRQGQVINIEEMQPNTEVRHCADAPASFALEMNRGWFEISGVVSGDKIEGLEHFTSQ